MDAQGRIFQRIRDVGISFNKYSSCLQLGDAFQSIFKNKINAQSKCGACIDSQTSGDFLWRDDSQNLNGSHHELHKKQQFVRPVGQVPSIYDDREHNKIELYKKEHT